MKSILERISTQLATRPSVQSDTRGVKSSARPASAKASSGISIKWNLPNLSITPENGVRRITSSKVRLTEADEKILDMAYQQSQSITHFTTKLMQHLFEKRELTDPSMTVTGAYGTRRLDKHTIEFIRQQIAKRVEPQNVKKTLSLCMASMCTRLYQLKSGRRRAKW